MGNVVALILWVVEKLLDALLFCIIVNALMSWLVAFNVMNTRHPFVRQVEGFLDAVTRPVLWPIRRVIPPLGGIDISPLIAYFLIQGVITFLIHPAIRMAAPVL